MLLTLHIENLAVVKKLDIDFNRGFNVITGETGAGKSIIIDAVGIILGGRVSKNFIRQGESYCQVSALFLCNDTTKRYLESVGYVCDEDNILVYREFNLNGRNVCKINGRPATNSILKQFGKYVINIYGQNDSFTLFSLENHIKYIDKFANLNDQIEEYKKVYYHMVDVENKIKTISIESSEKERKIDLLNYQIKELEDANIKIGEKNKLSLKKNVYLNYDKISNNINTVRGIMEDDNKNGVISNLEKVHLILKDSANYDKNLVQIQEKISNIYYETVDCISELYNYAESFEFDPEELERVESRLDFLYRLGTKYGSTESEMIEFLNNAKEELNAINQIDNNIVNLKKEYGLLEQKAKSMCDRISEIRLKEGKEFVSKIEKELKYLNMPSVKFKLQHSIGEIREIGYDNIEILVSVNKGDSEKTISKVASGGELSRIMLAIQTVISEDSIGTFIFDEVDTGVSGNTASKIGNKLKEISKGHQVICVTHLSQIACMADSHYLIEKCVSEDETFTKVKELDFKGRKYELARIISGSNITNVALDTAEEMLNINGIKED